MGQPRSSVLCNSSAPCEVEGGSLQSRAGGQGQAQAQYSYAQPALSAQPGKLVNC